ncbi:hypothetical protein [Aneurinibacillus aneurinilyticus]|uniref:hypothetical protein n=1 Tax=Aneurinibacillus aneurinilyticus TaxID=1391 RepID=UPI0023F20FBE|nr:hypothetical protein [Aneurinibacillus aneurinilyticus]
MSWNMREQEVLERTAAYDMSFMNDEQKEACRQRLMLNRIKLEMEQSQIQEGRK